MAARWLRTGRSFFTAPAANDRGLPRRPGLAGRRRLFVVLWLTAALAAEFGRAAEPIVEKYPDGAVKSSTPVNSAGKPHGAALEYYPTGQRKSSTQYLNGQKSGAYSAWHENGKQQARGTYANDQLQGKYQEFALDGTLKAVQNYRQGELHGVVQTLDGTTLVRDEFWSAGQLLLPRSQEQISRQLSAIYRAPVITEGQFPQVPAALAARLNDPARQKSREEALRHLNGYRYLAGVPHDVQLDRALVAQAEAGADLLQAIGRLDHKPANPGWPEAEYQLAFQGTSSSNIHSSTDGGLLRSIDAYLDDSDPRNIAKLGHRCWCLNPQMLRTGFGDSGQYHCMWALDRSRSPEADYDLVAFPPRGLVPDVAFEPSTAWSVMLNPAKYRLPEVRQLQISVVPAGLNKTSGLLEKAPGALPLEAVNVDNSGLGIGNAIIFRPVGLSTKSGAGYWCQIQGVRSTAGEERPLAWFVGFFKL